MGRFSLAGQKLTLRRALVASASGHFRPNRAARDMSALPPESDHGADVAGCLKSAVRDILH